MYHSCFHLSAFEFLLLKMNLGLSALHIVVGVADTIKQLLMVTFSIAAV